MDESGRRIIHKQLPCDLAAIVGDAVRSYVDEVRRQVFPDDDHAFHAPKKAAQPAEALTLVVGGAKVVGHH